MAPGGWALFPWWFSCIWTSVLPREAALAEGHHPCLQLPSAHSPVEFIVVIANFPPEVEPGECEAKGEGEEQEPEPFPLEGKVEKGWLVRTCCP